MEKRVRVMDEARQPRVLERAEAAAGFRGAIERERAQAAAGEIGLSDEGVVARAEEEGVVMRHDEAPIVGNRPGERKDAGIGFRAARVPGPNGPIIP